MRKQLLCGVAAIAVTVAMGGPVLAADLGVRKAPPPAPIAAPLPTWAGFYIGGHIGYGWSKMTGQNSGGSELITGDLKLNGAIAGVHAGYNWQYGQLVFGVEGDISGVFGHSWSKIVCNLSNCDTQIHGEMQGLASIRGRLGWAFDRTLIYATGGVAWGLYKSGLDVGSIVAPASATVTGGVFGGGVEWKYNPNLSFRLEGLQYIFDKTENNTVFGRVASFTIHPATVIRVGASYYF